MFFIFNWEVVVKRNKPYIIGFGFEESLVKRIALIVKDYPMYKYSTQYETKYTSVECKKYFLRNYLKGKQKVYKIFFSRYEDYKKYDSTLLNIDIASSFLVDQNLDTIGWVKVENIKQYKKYKYTTMEYEYLVDYTDIQKVESNKYPDCSVLSFDIECMSHDLKSFPNCYQFDDFISTISIVYRYKDNHKSMAICYKPDNVDDTQTNETIKNEKINQNEMNNLEQEFNSLNISSPNEKSENVNENKSKNENINGDESINEDFNENLNENLNDNINSIENLNESVNSIENLNDNENKNDSLNKISNENVYENVNENVNENKDKNVSLNEILNDNEDKNESLNEISNGNVNESYTEKVNETENKNDSINEIEITKNNIETAETKTEIVTETEIETKTEIDENVSDNDNNKSKENTKKKIIYVSTELALLKEFFNQISLLDPDIIIGFNIFGFDYHYISRRAGMYIKEVFKGSRVTGKNIEYNDIIGVGTEIYFPGRFNIDIYLYAKSLNLPQSSLNYVSDKMLNKQKIDLPYKEMFKLIEKGDEESLERVADYCIMDSQLTMDIFDVSHQWIQLLEVAKISRIKMDEVYKFGQSIKFTNLLYQFCNNRDICVDIDSKGMADYHGATVLEPKPNVYNLCSMLDFTSLYPSVIITHNICYTTLLIPEVASRMDKTDYHEINIGNKIYYFTKKFTGILPQMMKIFLSERRKFKELTKTATGIDKIIYDKRQWALKVQANSIYGCLGSKTLPYLRFLAGAECTTGMGRNYLNKTIGIIEETPFQVIYGDTDSCLIECPMIEDPELFIKNSQRVAEYVTSKLPEGMHLKYENTFTRLIIISKKKYSGRLIHTNNELYTRGMDIVKKNNSTYIKESYQTLINMILEGESSKKIRKYVLKVKSDLLGGLVPKEQLIMKLSINKKYKNKSFYVLQFLAYHKNHNLEYKSGEKVDYLIVKSLNPNVALAKRLGDKIISMDLYNDILENNPEKVPPIDYIYYYYHYMKTSLSLLLKTFDPSLLSIL